MYTIQTHTFSVWQYINWNVTLLKWNEFYIVKYEQWLTIAKNPTIAHRVLRRFTQPSFEDDFPRLIFLFLGHFFRRTKSSIVASSGGLRSRGGASFAKWSAFCLASSGFTCFLVVLYYMLGPLRSWTESHWKEERLKYIHARKSATCCRVQSLNSKQ